MTPIALTEDHLRTVAQIISSACGLPAVATQDWCERAARTLLPARRDALIAVTIGTVSGRGELTHFESAGLINGSAGGVGADASLIRTPNASRLGWWLQSGSPGPEGRTELLRDTPAAEAWTLDPSGRRWRELGARDLLVGAVEFGHAGGGRWLIVELGVRGDASLIGGSTARVVEVALPELARRAGLAFGASASNPMNRITPREQLILEQLTLGRTVKQIAEALNRSPHTVHDHVKSLHRKLNASSRGELIARALGHVAPDERTAPPTVTLRPEIRTRSNGLLQSA